MGRPYDAVAKDMGMSHHTLRRWEHSKTEPSVADMFMLIDVQTKALPRFIACAFESNGLATPAFVQDRNSDGVDSLFESPVVGALLAALELEEYKKLSTHDNAILAAQISESAEVVQTLLNMLLAKKQVMVRNEKYHKASHAVDTSGYKNVMRRQAIRAYWYQRLLNGMEQPILGKDANVLSYFVHAASDSAIASIHERIRQLNRDVDIILRHDMMPKTKIIYSGIDLINIMDLPPLKKLHSSK